MEVEVLYEDNHLIACNKPAGMPVQADKTGDLSLEQWMGAYLKHKYHKPGDAFVGVIHRIDRPVSGLVLMAKTSKALERMNAQFRERKTEKRYWAVVRKSPPTPQGTLRHFLRKNEASNKSFVEPHQKSGTKEAVLHYSLINSTDNGHLLEIMLETGRHHQIRAQLSAIGCPISGDVKYGAKRPHQDLSIGLHSRSLIFVHPVSKDLVTLVAPLPKGGCWPPFQAFSET
jgi:23S rRNA pseudouridine1911/1915/1917 synthase